MKIWVLIEEGRATEGKRINFPGGLRRGLEIRESVFEVFEL